MAGASHAGDGRGPYPKTCFVCGKRVLMTGPDALWFESIVTGRRQEYRSYHASCFPRLKASTS